MQIAILIILGIIAILVIDIQSKYYKKYISGTNSDWLIIRTLNYTNKNDNVNDVISIYLEFVPIIGWEYKPWSTKYGEARPVTQRDYIIKRIISSDIVSQNTMCFIARGEAIYSYEGDSEEKFWQDLFEHAGDGKEIEVKGNLPKEYKDIIYEAKKYLKDNKK